MISRSLLLTPFLLCLGLASAQESPAAPVAPGTPAAKTDEVLRPGMLWGTVITRSEFQPLTGKERWGLYWRQSYWRPGAFFAVAGPALGAHLNNEPPQWGQGMEGYSKRYANRFARSAIRDTVSAAGSAALGYDVRYVKCDCKGFLPRFGHAIAWNFLTLNRNGNTVLNIPKIGGAFAGEFAGRTWMPAGYNGVGDAMRSGGTQLAIGALFNSIREFAPRKKK
ncbi:MAG: hypothetical protein IPP47_15190 [Bryobacterales bacterium]|nr:hypothetical protein [Bryobacterales bacterium]